MISVIVCSNKDLSYTIHSNHITKSIGCRHEYLRIDNTQNSFGICAAYNIGVKKATGDIIVFVHEDVFFVTQNWGIILEKKFSDDNAIGCIGVAGTQYLFQDNPFWVSAGRPFIKGKVIHETPEENRCILTVFSEEETDSDVIAVDGLFFAVRKKLFETIRFDEQTFTRFHFYDLDICMQIRKTHSIRVTTDILVKHFSGGTFKENWKSYGDKFIEKYRNDLPASCAESKPDSEKRISFDSFPLNTLLNQKTYNFILNLGKDQSEQKSISVTDIPDNPIIAVTGMHRSGTSCIAGLLSRCGFSAGTDADLLNDNKPQFDNQKGHFENLNVVLINNTLLTSAGGGWYNPPSPETIAQLGEASKEKIIRFNHTFEGSIIKDPRLCLTLDLWKKYCSRLQYVIICFRHPLGVAHSLNKRNDLPIEIGLNLWYIYNVRLIDSIESVPVIVVDYDNLIDHHEDDLFDILRVLKSPLSREEMINHINGFLDKKLNHHTFTNKDTETLPDTIKELYQILKSQSITVRMGRNQ